MLATVSTPMLAAEVVQPQSGVAVAALAVAVVGFVATALLGARNRPRRPEPAAATQELREEPPAVVDLLVGGFDVDSDAVAATLVDLAARKHVDIDEVAGGHVLVRLRRHRPDEELTRYEQRVLRHVEKVAGPDGSVPAEALSTGPEAASERWHKGFVREVVADAKGRDLCRRRWGFAELGVVWSFVVAAAVLAWLARALGEVTRQPDAYGSPGNLLWGLAFLPMLGLAFVAVRLTTGHAQRDTDRGLEVASHWTGVRAWYEMGEFASAPAASVAIWDRHLAYATAVNAAPTVERQLSFEAEHDRKAWSRYGGTFRRVRVRYWSLRPGWGQAPWSVAFSGVVQAAVAGALAYGAVVIARDELDALGDIDPQTRQWMGLAALVVAVALAPAALWAVAKFVLGVLDLFPRREVEGLVLRARTYATGHWLPKVVQWAMWSGRDEHGVRKDRQRRRRHYVAIDDGAADRITAYRVRRDRMAPQGSMARLKVSPLLGYVSSVEVVTPPPRSEAPVAHELAEEALDVAGGFAERAGARLGGTFAHLEGVTDDEGRPVLDQVDEDGVPLRERMAEAETMLGSMGDAFGRATGGHRRADGTPAVGELGERFADGVESGRDPTDER